MSLVGEIKTISMVDVGGFTAAIGRIKQSIGYLRGKSSEAAGSTRFHDISVRGIVQGDIRIAASNDWSTSSFYGLSDALSSSSSLLNANPKFATALTAASSKIKLAKTLFNTSGYTFGTTGPASKKMYAGSNLSSVSVQFKWYTPYMDGWGSAIAALSLLAWPSSIVNTRNDATIPPAIRPISDDQRDLLNSAYNSVKVSGRNHMSIIDLMINKIISNSKPSILRFDPEPMRKSLLNTDGIDDYEDLTKIRDDIFKQLHDTPLDSNFGMYIVKLRESKERTQRVLEAVDDRRQIRHNAGSIGRTEGGVLWYDRDLDNILMSSDETIQILDGNGDREEIDIPDSVGSIVSNIVGELANIVPDLIKGLVDSTAKSPPMVSLSIRDSANNIKYLLSPLVITSFSCNASRETANGVPVIVTIDIAFDYFQVNATNALQAPEQMFAGTPIFKVNQTRAKPR